jgi:hypothetical protein
MPKAELLAGAGERDELARQLAPLKNPYARAVRLVSQEMRSRGIPLSSAARKAIVHNATRVETGEISLFTVSFREIPILMREASAHLERGEYHPAFWFLLGTAMNAIPATPLVLSATAGVDRLRAIEERAQLPLARCRR